jgi:hypothetical protein
MNEEPRKGYCEAAKRTPNYKLRTSDLCGPCDPRLQRCCVALRAGLAAMLPWSLRSSCSLRCAMP